jgi:membrane-bound lytic murein transglycosylase D
MHAQRRREESFTPAIRRIARLMAHNRDDDNYLSAYSSLRLQRGQRDFIAAGLAVAPRYFDAIEAEFTRQGIPVEISRLAFVESSFNLRALSKVGASGVYQLMPETGRQYLRVVAGSIDERNDPIKASSAAAKLLKLYYNLTGSWPLAITAYNHGVGGIKRAVREVGSGDITHLINRYRGNAFGFAGKNFYASFLGVLATLKEADRLFPEVTRPEPLRYAAVKLPKETPIAALRKKYNVSLDEIAMLNPDLSRAALRAQIALPRGYVLKVPSREPRPTPASGLVPASLPPST